MDQKLTEFVSLLRKNGLKVSPPEVMDAVSAISLLGYDDRAIYRQALATTLSKSAADYPIFERCFEHFFCITPTPAEPAEKTAAPPFNLPAGLQFLFGKGEGASSGGQGAGQPIPSVPPSALGEQLLNQPDRIELELAQAIEKANLASIKVMTQQGLFGRRILMAMGLDDLERELAQLDGSAHPTAAKRAEQLRQKRDQLRTQIKETVQRYFRLAAPNNRDEIIRETPLNLLQESKDTRAIIQRMAKKLITQHRRRQKKASRGLIDVRRTLRGNMANDGILIQPHWRHIHKDRPRVMAICDVSGSVSRYARFLLLFLRNYVAAAQVFS